MKVQAIQCPICHDRIYSRADHDMHSCSCEAVFIDGGFSYTRTTWDGGRLGEEPPAPFELEIKAADRKQLYDDWNKHTDKFGLLRGVFGLVLAPKYGDPLNLLGGKTAKKIIGEEWALGEPGNGLVLAWDFKPDDAGIQWLDARWKGPGRGAESVRNMVPWWLAGSNTGIAWLPGTLIYIDWRQRTLYELGA